MIALASSLVFLLALAPARADLSWTDSQHDYVMISVGGGPPIPVTFDVGSVGLIVFESGVGPKAVATKDPPAKRGYGNDRYYNITFANATVSIGGMTTVKPLKIGVVHSIVCTSGKGCTPIQGAGLAALAKSRNYGILGVGPGNADLENPLMELPSPYNAGYVVSNSGIQLGVSGATGFTPLKLSAGTGSSYSAKYKTYNKYFNACFTAASTSLKNRCIPTMFDTGIASINIPESIVKSAPAGPAACEVTVAKALDFSFQGGSKSADFPLIASSVSHAVLGLPLLLDYDVMYSFASGTYGFRKHALTGPKRATGGPIFGG